MHAEIVGRPLPRDVLFVANHSSWLDIMLLAGATGAAFVSKAEVADWPLFGWMARLNRTIFVARNERRSVHDQAGALRHALAEGQPVALFPEGTTDGGVDVLPFRASLLAAVFPPLPRLRVQPVAIDYGPVGPDIAWTDGETAAANVRRILSRPGSTKVVLTFLAPMHAAEADNRKALATAARDAIVSTLDASALRHHAL